MNEGTPLGVKSTIRRYGSSAVTAPTADFTFLPYQGKSLKLCRLFNWTSLHKIGALAGNVRKINLKFKTYKNSFLFWQETVMHF
jgi:hypothetical protein